jgi:hypothetical protein
MPPALPEIVKETIDLLDNVEGKNLMQAIYIAKAVIEEINATVENDEDKVNS